MVSPTAATFYFYKSFWSVLQPKRCKIPQLGLHQSLPDLLRNLFRNPVDPDLALHQSLPDLHRNLFRNPVELDLAMHQSLPDLHLSGSPVWTWPGYAPKPPTPSPDPERCWTWPGSAVHQSLPDLLWNLLRNPRCLNLTWLCTKASQTFTFSGTLALHQSLLDLLRNLLRSLVEPDQARVCPSLEPSPEPLFFEPDLALHQSLPDLLRNLLRNPVEPDLALHQSLPDLLRNLLRNLVELDPAPAPVHTGAILGWRPH